MFGFKNTFLFSVTQPGCFLKNTPEKVYGRGEVDYEQLWTSIHDNLKFSFKDIFKKEKMSFFETSDGFFISTASLGEFGFLYKLPVTRQPRVDARVFKSKDMDEIRAQGFKNNLCIVSCEFLEEEGVTVVVCDDGRRYKHESQGVAASRLHQI